MSEKYFGAYCAQCNVWLRKSDHTLLHYPSAELVKADIGTDLDVPGVHFNRPHLYVPTEFGKEKATEYETLPAGSTICESLRDKWERESQRFIYA